MVFCCLCLYIESDKYISATLYECVLQLTYGRIQGTRLVKQSLIKEIIYVKHYEFYCSQCYERVKGTVHILSLFIRPHIVPNLYTHFFFSEELIFFEKVFCFAQ